MRIHFRNLWVIVSLVLSTSICAASMSKQQYLQSKNEISVAYDQAMKVCNNLYWNSFKVCMAEAIGAKRTASAKLLASYKPSSNSKYEELRVKANSHYAVALAKCNDNSVLDKPSCRISAEAIKINTINAASMSWGESTE